VEVQQIKKLNIILNWEIARRKSYEYYFEEEKPKTFISCIFGK